MKKTKAEKENEVLRNLLWKLVLTAERVSSKFGTDDDGVPSDWNEWIDLRTAIQQAKTNGKL